MEERTRQAPCTIFIELSKSYKLKAPVCPNLQFKNEEGMVISRCSGKLEDCLIVSDIMADERASLLQESDIREKQEELIKQWLEERGLTYSSLL